MLSRAFELIIDGPGALALDLPNCVQSFRSIKAVLVGHDTMVEWTCELRECEKLLNLGSFRQ